jgi:hypothetical protein
VRKLLILDCYLSNKSSAMWIELDHILFLQHVAPAELRVREQYYTLITVVLTTP